MKNKGFTTQHGYRPLNTILGNKLLRMSNLNKKKMKKENTLLVAGTRTIEAKITVQAVIYLMIKDVENLRIITGCAQGVDKIAREYAQRKNIKYTVYKAEWDKYGKSAGPIRNKEMAKVADQAVIIWDGKSKGAANMIKQLRENQVPTEIIKIEH